MTPADDGAPTWNTDAPPMRCESTEMISNTTVYVPSARSPGSVVVIVSSASVVPVETSAAESSRTRTDPPVSDTGSLNVSTTSGGATSSTSPSAGLTEISSA